MKGRKLVLSAAVGAVALAAIWAFLHRGELSADALQTWLDTLGPWAAPGFVVFYALGAMAFLPGAMLTLAGGAVFGPVLGTVLCVAGASLGATGAFLLARASGGEWVQERLGDGRLAELMRGVDEDGWRFVAFVRLVPLFPFSLLNYALGLTRIPTLQYVVATFVCIIPGAAAYNWLGFAGREAVEGSGTAIRTAMVALALLGTAGFVIPRVAKKLRGKG